ncbi:MAG: uroporphyrinogen decarboxylase [Thermoanaerobaculia bacterium]|nr:MAG: uroporphyrinogen decarboxylase [Thermoanaerobaculia bacterium]
MTTPPFLAACRCEPAAHTPVWVMRQAGRYLPEYRALREKHDFRALMRSPELAAEVTLQPVRRFPLDAAILFADIMTPLDGLGLGLRFTPGPVVDRPLDSRAAIEALAWPPAEEHVGYVLETIRAVRRELPAPVPLIGFAGAPFTLFCYLVEGKGSKGFVRAKAFLHAEPASAALLLEKLAELTIEYLTAQARAGAQALMIFDSWAGLLGPDDYRRFALPPVRRILEALAASGAPRIYFPNQGATLLEEVARLPVEVVGIDWRLPLSRARALLGPGIAVQGNLDPAALFAPDAALESAIDRVLEEAGPGPGHVFNLGHGIEAATDPGKVALLVERVHRRTAKGATP